MEYKDRRVLLAYLYGLKELNKWTEDEVKRKHHSHKQVLMTKLATRLYQTLYDKKVRFTTILPNYHTFLNTVGKIQFYAKLTNYESRHYFNRRKRTALNFHINRALSILNSITPEAHNEAV